MSNQIKTENALHDTWLPCAKRLSPEATEVNIFRLISG